MNTLLKFSVRDIVFISILFFLLVYFTVRIASVSKRNFFGFIYFFLTLLSLIPLYFFWFSRSAVFSKKALPLTLSFSFTFFIGYLIYSLADVQKAITKVFKSKEERATTHGSIETKEEVISAAVVLSYRKIGAIICFEKYNSLSHYAEKAIPLNSTVNKELLLNIFTPNTPLHDGAVIIKNDTLICAGAYFTISKTELADKTTGSRHRAALGISEETDALTLVVSEETGNISIAYNGVLMKMKDVEQLRSYLNLYV